MKRITKNKIKMKVCGFTIVKNAVKYKYPIVEVIKSTLPLVDKFYVALDRGEDNSDEYIQSINSEKIDLHYTKWAAERKSDLVESWVLSTETNKCFDKISNEYDWVIYLQADEVLHEAEYEKLLCLMKNYKNNEEVDGFLFHYYHFWGNFNYISYGRHAFRRAVRIIRNDKNIRSIRDALSFKKKSGDKLVVVDSGCHIYHYGWVRPPKTMERKTIDATWTDSLRDFDYNKDYQTVLPFYQQHPAVMKSFQEKIDWKVKIDSRVNRVKGKNRFLNWFEKKTGHRLFESQQFIIYGLGERWTNIWDRPLF